ncbi:velvet factor family protein [Aspergillus clavatus NRRL 1]|uniref:Velvet domain-containing protein n=1 Tax=Aspergillus clavatus (strain ATCC 1007 / CBS 513.65 / DSM 816 / NCTC 3887 / NRRL 1 / QM 1276 / 107) TaxID=344612 RepID=A1CHS5_ASPCL|nr:uncharacterized protein ACLA_049020 [Aspergillus clavatus NRRL 1]EAW10430.1 conserved hypothetical protein [Aspergillus clavatus NRRL 1]
MGSVHDQLFLDPDISIDHQGSEHFCSLGSRGNHRFLWRDVCVCMTNQSISRSQGIDPAVVPTAADFRFNLAAQPWNSGTEQRYGINSSHAGSMSQLNVRRSGHPRGADQKDSPTPINAEPLPQIRVRRSGQPRNAENFHLPHYGSSSRGHGRSSIGPGAYTNEAGSRSTALPSPVHPEVPGSNSTTPKGSSNLSKPQLPKTQRQGPPGIPLGFDKLLHHSPEPSPPPRRASASSRYHLYIRQQPIAARACGAGDRDRRPVDPPPIVQILLTDFNARSQVDLDILQDPRLTVGCLLLPVTGHSWPGSPEADGTGPNREERSVTQRAEENAPGQSTPLLSGKAFVSPFYVDADPDSETAPLHPTTPDLKIERRSSSTTGFESAQGRIPATFFVFPDLSIRTAGVYRFQFRLMNWGLVEDTGQSMPILAEVWSDPFRVYSAKDFPGMRDSSPLTEALKELGVVELKTRGKGKGKGRRR